MQNHQQHCQVLDQQDQQILAFLWIGWQSSISWWWLLCLWYSWCQVCTCIKRCNKQAAPAGTFVCTSLYIRLHQVVHPFAPGGAWYIGTLDTLAHPARLVCAQTIYIYADALCLLQNNWFFALKTPWKVFLLQHKAVLESHYQAPVV